MMLQDIYHIVVWLLFHKVVQSCDIWFYMSMISLMLHLLWWGKVVCTSQIATLCLEKRSKKLQICKWCEVIIKGLCEPNLILPLLATRSTNRLRTNSYWQVWVQFQVVAIRYHMGK